MADLSERRERAAQALDAFAELVSGDEHDAVSRDAAILRFVFALEAVLAAARHYLREVEGETRTSPGACIRASRNAGLIGDETAEALLAAAQDRNRAVHVYDEAMALALYRRLPDHLAALRAWMAGLSGAG